MYALNTRPRPNYQRRGGGIAEDGKKDRGETKRIVRRERKMTKKRWRDRKEWKKRDARMGEAGKGEMLGWKRLGRKI